SGEAEPLLMNYEVDLALVMDSQFSPDTTMVGEMNLIVQVIMDAGHPLATREQLKISDLTAYPLALPSENSNLFMHLERLMLASQIHLKPQIQCSHAAFIQQCTKGSELLSFMLTPNNEDRNLPDGLVARPLAHRKASICAKLLQLKGRTLSVAASRFLEMIAADFDFVASSDRKATAD
ncbi:MAG: LysR family transcriptional regulator substrate-binding protein, partial [Alphaproteobacteria bacterium]